MVETLTREFAPELDATEAEAEVQPRTVLHDPHDKGPDLPKRDVRSKTFREQFDVAGAGIGAAALTTLLFGWFAPLSGVIGWVVVAFLAFIALYVLLVSLDNNLMEVKDRLAAALFTAAGVLVVGVLVFIVVYTIVRGAPALMHVNHFVETMEITGPLEPLTQGGIAHAIVGTLIQISIALAITIPLGIGTAIFLNEVGGRFARFVRTVSDAMTALPSIVAGLFIYAALILAVTKERSGFAAALAITVMMLPVVIRSADGGVSWAVHLVNRVVLALRTRAFATERDAHEDARLILQRTLDMHIERLKDPDRGTRAAVVVLDDEICMVGGWVWHREGTSVTPTLQRFLEHPVVRPMRRADDDLL